MKKIVHILKEPKDPHFLSVIGFQMKESQVHLVLIQEAVGMESSLPEEMISVLKEDAIARKVTPRFKAIDYQEFLDLILTADAVTTW